MRGQRIIGRVGPLAGSPDEDREGMRQAQLLRLGFGPEDHHIIGVARRRTPRVAAEAEDGQERGRYGLAHGGVPIGCKAAPLPG